MFLDTNSFYFIFLCQNHHQEHFLPQLQPSIFNIYNNKNYNIYNVNSNSILYQHSTRFLHHNLHRHYYLFYLFHHYPHHPSASITYTTIFTQTTAQQAEARMKKEAEKDMEVFDDGDFYQKLLMEKTKRKTNSTSDMTLISK